MPPADGRRAPGWERAALDRPRLDDERRLARRREAAELKEVVDVASRAEPARRRETQPARRLPPPRPEPIDSAAQRAFPGPYARYPESNLAVTSSTSRRRSADRRRRPHLRRLRRRHTLAAHAGHRAPVAGDRRQPPLRRLSAERLRHRSHALSGHLPPARPPGRRNRVSRRRLRRAGARPDGKPGDPHRAAGLDRQRHRSGVPRPRARQPLGHGNHERARAHRRRSFPHDSVTQRDARSSAYLRADTARCISR